MEIDSLPVESLSKLLTTVGITAFVHAEDIEISGELPEWSRTAASGNTSSAKLCYVCGNHICHVNPAEPDGIMLKRSTCSQ